MRYEAERGEDRVDYYGRPLRTYRVRDNETGEHEEVGEYPPYAYTIGAAEAAGRAADLNEYGY